LTQETSRLLSIHRPLCSGGAYYGAGKAKGFSAGGRQTEMISDEFSAARREAGFGVTDRVHYSSTGMTSIIVDLRISASAALSNGMPYVRQSA
jgi:hypothetical protein